MTLPDYVNSIPGGSPGLLFHFFYIIFLINLILYLS